LHDGNWFNITSPLLKADDCTRYSSHE
jgi:hypothetical protein